MLMYDHVNIEVDIFYFNVYLMNLIMIQMI